MFAADYITNLLGIKRFGGSRAAIWGSTIGLLAGPFVIPVAGIILGPFIGALAGEVIVHQKDLKTAARIGIGSLIGFISGVFAKSVIQLMMIGYFYIPCSKIFPCMFKKKGKRIKFSERLKCICDHFVSISIETSLFF